MVGRKSVLGSIGGMKISISLEEKDLTFLDKYASAHSLETRSAAMRKAIDALRKEELAWQYEQAFSEWEGSENQKFWDRFSGDGIDGDEAW